MKQNADKPKKTRRRYSDDFRASALAALEANGGNVERTAKALKIPPTTLEQWAKGTRNPVSPQLREQKTLDLTYELEQFVYRLVHHPIAEGSNLKDVGIAVGIACDKLLALKGMPTIINKTIDGKENIIDPSKMSSAQRKALGAFLDELNRDSAVQYNPAPGDPDYDPGLPADGDGAAA